MLSRLTLGWVSLLLLGLSLWGQAPPRSGGAQATIPERVDLSGSFTFRVSLRLESAPADLPLVVSNKDWESGEVLDYTTNNAFGLGRASGSLAGFAISVLPDGAWTFNAGDGSRRIDHRPEASDQGVADGRWHEVGFVIDREEGVAELYHDGRRVALHDLSGLGSLASKDGSLELGTFPGLETRDLRVDARVHTPASMRAQFVERFGEARRPPDRATWDGSPLKVLAWNIWHGGRRKGRDEGVARVVETIRSSGADIVLMQETYGSGPRIAGRLGFDYFLRSSNLSVMSRFPIREVHRLGPAFRFGGVTIELAPGVLVQAYSLWIHYLPSVEAQLADGASAGDLIAADEETRGTEIKAILAELEPHLARSPHVPVLVGGDFNSGSHLDWTAEAAALENHHGRVVAWPVSVAMQAAGFLDTYRVAHPDPVDAPGWTWSPEFTEGHQDRIDYVYARGDAWRVVDSKVLNTHPDGWPSDHAAVLSTLELRPRTDRVRVMTYNIKHGLGNDDVLDLERAARVIERAAPDVVTLAEIDDGCRRSGGVDQAAWLGRRLGMHALFGEFMPYDGGRYGMALLTKLPIVAWENHPLPPGSEPRTTLAARLRLSSGQVLVVAGVHLYETEAERLAQAEAIDALFRDANVPVVLAGDFNSRPGGPVMDSLDRPWRIVDKGADRLTFPSDEPRVEIDYFVVRGARVPAKLTCDVLDEPLASDHRPLVFDLVLERGAR